MSKSISGKSLARTISLAAEAFKSDRLLDQVEDQLTALAAAENEARRSALLRVRRTASNLSSISGSIPSLAALDRSISNLARELDVQLRTAWVAGSAAGTRDVRRTVRLLSRSERTGDLAGVSSSSPQMQLVLQDMRDNIERFRDRIAALLTQGDHAATMRASTSMAIKAEQAAAFMFNRAYNEAKLQGMSQVDQSLRVQKMWVAIGDERLCPECGALDGTVIGLQEEWDWKLSLGPSPRRPYQDLIIPPRHPRCRCTITTWTSATEADAGTTAAARQRATRRLFDAGTSRS